MAKKVRVTDSPDAPSPAYHTLPGGTGSLTRDASPISDTIFGQTLQSNEVGLINWSIAANALYKGFAGYVATLKKGGTPTTMTQEATTLVSGKTYQINDTAKRLWDRNTTVVVRDNAIAVSAANIQSIDYLFGKVTFVSTYSVNGTVDVSGKYLPLATLGKGNSFTLTQTAEAINTTDFATAQANGGNMTHDPGLRTVSLEISGFYDITNAFHQALLDRDELVIEVNPDGTGKSIARGFFRLLSAGQDGDVGALENETVSFSLNVPENIDPVFTWQHAVGTTLSNAIRVCLDAWLTETKVGVQYLPDDDDGFSGRAVVTSVTLSSGLDAMNTFEANFQGDGALGVVTDLT
jgi:hypothetical protein